MRPVMLFLCVVSLFLLWFLLVVSTLWAHSHSTGGVGVCQVLLLQQKQQLALQQWPFRCVVCIKAMQAEDVYMKLSFY
jgi:hypothetical protein